MPTARPKDIHSIPVFYRDYVSEVPGDDLNVALLLASVSVFLLSMRERSQAKKGGRRSRSRSDDQTADW